MHKIKFVSRNRTSKAGAGVALLLIMLTSCTPAASPTATKALLPTVTASAIPTSTLTPVLVTGLPPQPTSTPNPVQAERQERIKKVIQTYFEVRYRAFSLSPPADFQQNGFGDLVSDGVGAQDFRVTEMAKLAVERKWYELNQYRFAKYKYSLKYKDIVLDPSAQRAEISLTEYFEIICERSMKNNPDNPHPCAVGDLTHKISLQNEQGQWKITADIYRDSWWRQFRTPGASTDEILHNIHVEMHKLETMASPAP
jgi:hypothetical protein